MQMPHYTWIALCAVLVVSMTSCRQEQADMREIEADSIRRTYANCLRAAQDKDIEAVVSCYAEDAVLLGADAPMRNGREAIRQFYTSWFESAGFALNPTVTKLEVSRSSDLAYDFGTFNVTLTDAAGKPITGNGKFVHIWRKEADGSWKLIVAIPSADQPPGR